MMTFLGYCHASRRANRAKLIAAACCSDPDAFAEMIRPALAAQGYQLDLVTSVLPAEQFLAVHPSDEGRLLADAVWPGRPVMLGAMQMVDASADESQFISASSEILARDATPETIAKHLFAGGGRLIACIDANRITNLPMLLETEGLGRLCLFKGDLAEETGAQAPWLVSLTPDDRFLLSLLRASGRTTESPYAHLEREVGIFLATDAPIDLIQRHLRRFLRVQAQDQRFFFFRFWEPWVAKAYFPGLRARPDMVRRWFVSRENAVITRISVVQKIDEQPVLTHIAPTVAPQDLPEPPLTVFNLTPEDVSRFQDQRLSADLAQLAERLADTFPQSAGAMAPDDLRRFVDQTAQRLIGLGFRSKANLFVLLAWEIHLGPGFETRDPEGILTRIFSDPAPENERMGRLKDRMAQFG